MAVRFLPVVVQKAVNVFAHNGLLPSLRRG